MIAPRPDAARPATEGLPLPRTSVSWRVIREPAVLAASAGRALLLQVAHPLVAAGVEQHSDYERDPWNRLSRTLDTMLKLAFAPADVGDRKAVLLARRHATVHGTAADGTPYDARDPDLLLWVWETLVDSSLVGYRHAVGPLSEAERDTFVREQGRVARACGVPADLCPASAAALRADVTRTVDHDLRPTSTARAVAQQILRPPVPWPLRPLAGAGNALVTTALLPPRVRTQLGLPWDRRREVAATAAFAASRAASRLVPVGARQAPIAHLVERPRPLALSRRR